MGVEAKRSGPPRARRRPEVRAPATDRGLPEAAGEEPAEATDSHPRPRAEYAVQGRGLDPGPRRGRSCCRKSRE
eukprot:11160333-Lingulodinium_polyedra.AAC.1